MPGSRVLRGELGKHMGCQGGVCKAAGCIWYLEPAPKHSLVSYGQKSWLDGQRAGTPVAVVAQPACAASRQLQQQASQLTAPQHSSTAAQEDPTGRQ